MAINDDYLAVEIGKCIWAKASMLDNRLNASLTIVVLPWFSVEDAEKRISPTGEADEAGVKA